MCWCGWDGDDGDMKEVKLQTSSSTPASSLLWWCGDNSLDTGEWCVSDSRRRHV